ncbi:MAG: DNA ligase D, partial [Chlorobia bacterium]|nr:DNA ligase D [Fimbriimonadaceae bacterium]
MVDKKRNLSQYHRKRKFANTPEPRHTTTDAKLIYVVQKHDATRLHYDFRLEHDGALLSWAVPKEPSTDPSIKRLAVRVEDHPVDYATFEGTIPKGNYGAGTVEIWDRGTWKPEGDVDQSLRDGDLKFHVSGERLKGKWVLVRMGEPSEKENWLLIKEKDSKPIPHDLGQKWDADKPPKHQLAELKSALPTGEDWLYEIKWDGYRAFAVVESGICKLISRNGNDLKLPILAKEIAKYCKPNAIIDGEIVALTAVGRSDFSLLQNQLKNKPGDVRFVAFDLVMLAGFDIRGLPLSKRRSALEQTLAKATDKVMISPRIDGDSVSVYRSACELGLEGIVAKRATSQYAGRRSSDWIKVKCRRSIEATVVGFTFLQGSRSLIGALLLADDSLQYMGRVGSGFSEQVRSELWKRLDGLGTSKPSVAELTALQRKGVHWVVPKLKVRVEYADRTSDGILRQASYQGEAIGVKPEPKKRQATMVKLTSPDRVLDSESKSTKLDAFQFYQDIAPYLMPCLKDRMVAMLRCPDGVSGDCFFQKHLMAGKFKGMVEAKDGDDDFVTIKNPSGLLEASQMGVMEFHPWGSRIRTIEKPDQLIFDLDPGPDVSWADIVKAAEYVRERLQSIGIDPFYKLSGGKGVHLVASIKPELEWADAKAFCKTLAEQIASEKPKQFISVSNKEKRKGKIYIDYLRNGRGSTAISAYSLRARPGLPVAMPVTFEELLKATGADQFHIGNSLAYLERRKIDPWQDFAKNAVSLKRILQP